MAACWNGGPSQNTFRLAFPGMDMDRGTQIAPNASDCTHISAPLNK